MPLACEWCRTQTDTLWSCIDCQRRCCASCLDELHHRCVYCPDPNKRGMLRGFSAIGDLGRGKGSPHVLVRRKWQHTKSTASGLRKARKRN